MSFRRIGFYFTRVIFLVVAPVIFLKVNAEEPNLQALKEKYRRPEEIPFLKSNPYSKEKETLGKLLFFDTRLSKSNMISCASCHNPSFSWGDGLPKAVGHEHRILSRKSPTIQNLAWYETLMWDGRFKHYEGQVPGPLGSAEEMAMTTEGPEALLAKIKSIEGYREYFKNAFPEEKDPYTMNNISNAIGIFERTIVSGQAPFDEWINGKEDAISEEAKLGFKLFNGKASCTKCHSEWNFSDGSFHDIGLKSEDLGRGKHLKLKSQQYAFKTPGLRNIVFRGPYMHDGSEANLEKVVEFYNRGGDSKRESLSRLIKPLNLTKREIKAVVEFMKTLTGNDPSVEFPKLPR